MKETIDISTFFELKNHIPVVDVRSPGEWEQGHIPGSINIPIFLNNERAEVGTIYKKKNKEIAIERGLEIVGPKLHSFVKKAKTIAINNKIIIHCWRGGMRSSSMAWLFETAGLEPIIVEGGYKAYRRYIRDSFNNDVNLMVLGGYTGSGKTEILKKIEEKGYQFLDIEGFAHHKGSSFGTIGQLPQVTNEQFENNLADKWLSFDFSKIIWIEDESIQLGRNRVPNSLYALIRSSKVISLIIPRDIRAIRLTKEYVDPDITLLENAVLRIQKKLGGLKTKMAIDAIQKRNFLEAAKISLEYYDKTYAYGLSKRDPQTIISIKINEDNPEKTAEYLIKEYS